MKIWNAYRKMYGIMAAIFGISFILGVAAGAFVPANVRDVMVKGIAYTIQIIFGLMSNFLYRRKIEKSINKIKNMELDKESMLQEIKKKGGVSVTAMLIVLAINIGLNFYSGAL